MEVFSAVLFLIPVVLGVAILLASLPLYLTVKFFNVSNNTIGTAVKITLLAWLCSLGIGLVLGLIGFVVPFIPHVLAMIAPFAVYIMLIQNYYSLEFMGALIVAVVQVIISFILGIGLFMAILVPLGVGAALFSR